jgi:hypothetical protein
VFNKNNTRGATNEAGTPCLKKIKINRENKFTVE